MPYLVIAVFVALAAWTGLMMYLYATLTKQERNMPYLIIAIFVALAAWTGLMMYVLHQI